MTDTYQKKTALIDHLRDGCPVSEACKKVGVSKSTAYKWKKNDPDFSEIWEDITGYAALDVDRKVKKDRVVHNLATGLTVRGAAEMAGVPRSMVYHWKNHDPEFADRLREAEEAGKQFLEDTAWDRAVNGVPKPAAVYQGEVTEWQREYSNDLLKTLLAARDPERFGRQRIEHSGHMTNTTISVEMRDTLKKLGEDEVQQFANTILGLLGIEEGGDDGSAESSEG